MVIKSKTILPCETQPRPAANARHFDIRPGIGGMQDLNKDDWLRRACVCSSPPPPCVPPSGRLVIPHYGYGCTPLTPIRCRWCAATLHKHLIMGVCTVCCFCVQYSLAYILAYNLELFFDARCFLLVIKNVKLDATHASPATTAATAAGC